MSKTHSGNIEVRRTVLGSEEPFNALVDPAVGFECDKYVWFLSPSGYAWSVMNGKPKTLHRFVFELLGIIPKGMVIDHKEGDRLDERMEKLRLATVQQNNMNRSVNKNNILGIKGVYQRAETKFKDSYRAQITINHIHYSLGDYADKYVASYAYNLAAVALFGDWAWLNELPTDFDYVAARAALSPKVLSFAVAGGID